MNRRQFIAAPAAAGCAFAPPHLRAQPFARTRWVVRGSEGFDALSFLGPLSGDPFYARYYEQEAAAFAVRMPAAAMSAIRELKARAAAANILVSPFLDLRFSAGPDRSIADLIDSLDHAESVLRPPFQASPYWGEDGEADWRAFMSASPQIRAILASMQEAGFGEFRASLFEPKAAVRFPGLRDRLRDFDVVAEVERFTGRSLDPTVEVVLLEFCKPHGVKVIGQRFLSAIDWNDDVVIRTAGHELLHPPVDLDGPAAQAALAVLRRDPLLARIVAEHDPAFGYTSLRGLFDEDLASAVDQIIADRLGTARDPHARWNDVDDGMHVLSAAFYTLMRRSGHASAGGDLEAWLADAVRRGWLEPAVLHAAAADLLGRPAEALWPLPAAA